MKTILIIEDDNDIRENIAEFLQLEGYEVFAALNGKEGLQIAMTIRPDVIICDIVMPVMDGYAVYEALQNSDVTRNIRFIFSTAQSQRDEINKAHRLGVKCYLLKPFDDKQLTACIDAADSQEFK